MWCQSRLQAYFNFQQRLDSAKVYIYFESSTCFGKIFDKSPWIWYLKTKESLIVGIKIDMRINQRAKVVSKKCFVFYVADRMRALNCELAPTCSNNLFNIPSRRAKAFTYFHLKSCWKLRTWQLLQYNSKKIRYPCFCDFPAYMIYIINN